MLPPGVQSIFMSTCMRLSVCCTHISKTPWPNFTKFCACYLLPWLGPPLAALFYVLPVSWMTLRFHTVGSVVSHVAVARAFLSNETESEIASIPTRLCSTINIGKYTMWVARRGPSLLSTIILSLCWYSAVLMLLCWLDIATRPRHTASACC